jgi:hypothetical protein
VQEASYLLAVPLHLVDFIVNGNPVVLSPQAGVIGVNLHWFGMVHALHLINRVPGHILSPLGGELFNLQIIRLVRPLNALVVVGP